MYRSTRRGFVGAGEARYRSCTGRTTRFRNKASADEDRRDELFISRAGPKGPIKKNLADWLSRPGEDSSALAKREEGAGRGQ